MAVPHDLHGAGGGVMQHLGDITKLDGAAIEPVWCVTGGSPCQDMSTAGKRAGLAGARSGLFMEQIRVIKEMREHDKQLGRTGELIRPRYMVWENVPGALGNSIALPFWRWMFGRMAVYLPEGATLGSLFDGIGGFPLCWEDVHGVGTAIWASEIEEFPIAVTKKRFGGVKT